MQFIQIMITLFYSVWVEHQFYTHTGISYCACSRVYVALWRCKVICCRYPILHIPPQSLKSPRPFSSFLWWGGCSSGFHYIHTICISIFHKYITNCIYPFLKIKHLLECWPFKTWCVHNILSGKQVHNDSNWLNGIDLPNTIYHTDQSINMKHWNMADDNVVLIESVDVLWYWHHHF
jgi:hypothetical protein